MRIFWWSLEVRYRGWYRLDFFYLFDWIRVSLLFWGSKKGKVFDWILVRGYVRFLFCVGLVWLSWSVGGFFLGFVISWFGVRSLCFWVSGFGFCVRAWGLCWRRCEVFGFVLFSFVRLLLGGGFCGVVWRWRGFFFLISLF